MVFQVLAYRTSYREAAVVVDAVDLDLVVIAAAGPVVVVAAETEAEEGEDEGLGEVVLHTLKDRKLPLIDTLLVKNRICTQVDSTRVTACALLPHAKHSIGDHPNK